MPDILPDKEKEPVSGENGQKKDSYENVVESVFGGDRKREGQSSIFQTIQIQKTEDTSERESGTKDINDAPKKSKGAQLKKFLFRKKPEKRLSLGVDLGSHFIKIVELALNDGRFKVNKLIMEELPVRLDGNLQDNQVKLTGFLKEILKKNDIDNGEAYFSIPAGMVQMKTHIFPPMPQDEISEAVRIEMIRMTKDNIDTTMFDYVVLDENKISKTGIVKVLVITVPKQIIRQQLNIFDSAGLKGLAIEPDVFSLLASLNHRHAISDKDKVLLIDIGGEKASLSIISNREVRYNKGLRTNGHIISSAVKDYCKIPLKEAEQLLRDYNFSVLASPEFDGNTQAGSIDPNYKVQIKNALSFVLEKLAAEVERAFKYYSYEVSKSEVTSYNKVILAGGAAAYPAIKQYLGGRLNVPVEVFNPLKGLKMNESAGLKENYFSNAPSFSVALGLALRAIE